MTLPISSCSTIEPLHANSSAGAVEEHVSDIEAYDTRSNRPHPRPPVREEARGRRRRTLERLQELLGVILGGDALEGRDGLAAVALLDTDVDVVGCRARSKREVSSRSSRTGLVSRTAARRALQSGPAELCVCIERSAQSLCAAECAHRHYRPRAGRALLTASSR